MYAAPGGGVSWNKGRTPKLPGSMHYRGVGCNMRRVRRSVKGVRRTAGDTPESGRP